MLIKNVTLTYIPSENIFTLDVKKIIAAFFSVSANQMPGFRQISLLLGDIWIYNYDKVKYKETI